MGFCHDEKGFFPEKAKNVCRDDRCREGGGANLTGIRTVNFTILLEITQTKESQTMKPTNKQQKLSINDEISANCRYFEVRSNRKQIMAIAKTVRKLDNQTASDMKCNCSRFEYFQFVFGPNQL